MTDAWTDNARLSALQAAWVVARRDFVAVLFSRAFFFFLLGPLFPVFVGGLAGGIGSQVQKETFVFEIGLAMDEADSAAMIAAQNELVSQVGGQLPKLVPIGEEAQDPEFDAKSYLQQKRRSFAAIVSGTLEAPVIVGTEGQIKRWEGPVRLIAAAAARTAPTLFPTVEREVVATSASAQRGDRIRTAQAAQMLLFLLTMLLAGMVLSNLVEEKANKIIEILAAAIPMDAVFLGKLFAMLAVSIVGITVWGLIGLGIWSLAGEGVTQVTGFNPGNLPSPAVGWPMFLALGVIYFAMAYLLLGALFLTIGAMAATVREVQTLSMPVTMMQLMVFFLAAYTITQPGTSLELAAIAFPLSSPFAMLARAALQESLLPHLLAVVWQAIAVMLIVKGGSTLFRKRVMKSGGAGREKSRRRLFRRARAVN
ncbi:ABC transporter permease [Altererythrobacter arenosus]|uniref:ABC transporter permease n=1 Tax=Altererythrobacter arenosus TaxID=3032592 RepID=A0ABY8FYR1_9SPHN|nr:ABC transporter permease [Altererythrobacter sp. CAU 1644]WFL78526.1 ABC transporter permease [Altererythrobacter sp. CAU 1644]